MNTKYSTRLVEQLQEVLPFEVDVPHFLKVLNFFHIQKSRRFSEEIPEHTPQTIQTGQFGYTNFSLLRILRNENSSDYKLNPITKGIESVKTFVGYSNSSTLTRDLRFNSELVELMMEQSQTLPFSLLGRIDNFNFENSENRQMLIQKTPVLIIPEISIHCIPILEWETRNTQYFVERSRFNLLPPKKISKQEYGRFENLY